MVGTVTIVSRSNMKRIRRLFTYIKRFYYYGKIGASETYDFNGSCIHTLIHAHISRVSDFMHDPKATHLVWNSNPQNKLMRQLREFTELSRRHVEGEYSVGHYTKIVFDKHRPKKVSLIGKLNDPRIRKEFRIAAKKDLMIKKGLEDRYYYLLRYVVPSFWD